VSPLKYLIGLIII
jgi:DNA repair protein RAD7